MFQGPKYQEIVNIRLGNGTIRRGQVLEVDGEKAVVQVPSIILRLLVFSCSFSWFSLCSGGNVLPEQFSSKWSHNVEF